MIKVLYMNLLHITFLETFRKLHFTKFVSNVPNYFEYFRESYILKKCK